MVAASALMSFLLLDSSSLFLRESKLFLDSNFDTRLVFRSKYMGCPNTVQKSLDLVFSKLTYFFVHYSDHGLKNEHNITGLVRYLDLHWSSFVLGFVITLSSAWIYQRGICRFIFPEFGILWCKVMTYTLTQADLWCPFK